ITYMKALQMLSKEGLFVRQLNGKIYIDQITAYDNPTSVKQTVYNADGTVKTATTRVDVTDMGYTSVSDGTPAVKITSGNETYPPVWRAKSKFNHRSTIGSGAFINDP